MGVNVELFGEVRPSAAAIAAAKRNVQGRANAKAAKQPADSKLLSLAVEYANPAGEKTMVVTATPQRWQIVVRRKVNQFPWVIAALGAALVISGASVIITRPPDIGPGSVVLSSDSPAPVPSLLSVFPSMTPGQTPEPSVAETPEWIIAPTATPTPINHTVTRIVFSRARVDLPVITAPSDETFPYCDVAERMDYYSEPGAGGVTYLYAHATHYMFGGLLAASWQPDSYLMGQQIQIYTSDDLVYTYAVTAIVRHQPYDSFSLVNETVGEALILQTCEDNDAAGPKLLIIARPVNVNSASHGDAHPPTNPRVCAHGY